jgi:putative transposase
MEKLTPNSSYHIFNHANGFENVFVEDRNYTFFLEKYQKFIQPIAETYAYCLLPNHFHLVIRIRKKEVIEKLIREQNLYKSPNFDKDGSEENENSIEKYLSKQFANLFSSYTQSFNKVYKRMGSLFIKNFKRELISDKEYFINAVVYTHRNPIHHSFCRRYTDWSYSSYSQIIEDKSTLIDVHKLVTVFDGVQSFKSLHQEGLEKLYDTISFEVPH